MKVRRSVTNRNIEDCKAGICVPQVRAIEDRNRRCEEIENRTAGKEIVQVAVQPGDAGSRCVH